MKEIALLIVVLISAKETLSKQVLTRCSPNDVLGPVARFRLVQRNEDIRAHVMDNSCKLGVPDKR